MPTAVGQGANAIALCDADAARIANTRKALAQKSPEVEQARGYEDYRELIVKEKSLDGVLIAVGPWWHAPLSTAFIKAGKHVYCEKPLTRLVSEARALGQLAKESRVTTQMGTQGAASESFRRAVEIIQAGLLGQIDPAPEEERDEVREGEGHEPGLVGEGELEHRLLLAARVDRHHLRTRK